MRITVFGATGATGRELLAAALAAGHTVRAFARRPEALGELSAKGGYRLARDEGLRGGKEITRADLARFMGFRPHEAGGTDLPGAHGGPEGAGTSTVTRSR